MIKIEKQIFKTLEVSLIESREKRPDTSSAGIEIMKTVLKSMSLFLL